MHFEFAPNEGNGFSEYKLPPNLQTSNICKCVWGVGGGGGGRSSIDFQPATSSLSLLFPHTLQYSKPSCACVTDEVSEGRKNRGPTRTQTQGLSLTVRPLFQMRYRATWSSFDIPQAMQVYAITKKYEI